MCGKHEVFEQHIPNADRRTQSGMAQLFGHHGYHILPGTMSGSIIIYMYNATSIDWCSTNLQIACLCLEAT